MAEEKQGMLERAKEAVKAAGKRVAEGNREGLGALLDKMIGKQKVSAAKTAAKGAEAFPVEDTNLRTYHEAEQLATEHPEWLDEFGGSFDDFAKAYMNGQVNPGLTKTMTITEFKKPIRHDEQLMPNAEPITVEKKTIDVEPITTEQFLDRLTRK